MQMEAGLSQWDDPQLKGTYIVGFSLSLKLYNNIYMKYSCEQLLN